MFLLYRILTFALAPWALWRLHGRAGSRYRRRWRERLGRIEAVTPGGVWIHAASVGEVNAGRGLIGRMLERYSPVVVSTVTATGAEHVGRLFGDRVVHCFLPLDTPGAVTRWLDAVQPRIALILETELWPVLYRAVARRDIPLALVSARLSENSARRYRWIRPLVSTALEDVQLIACQTDADAARFRTLGARPERIRVAGNLKFDSEPPVESPSGDLRTMWGNRPVWVAGSTHRGEEELLLACHEKIRERFHEALLILAPRHPDRADAVARILASRGWSFVRLGQPVPAESAVVLVDRIGELTACYAAGDVAFVGGSLVDVGGHNLLEPAWLRRPVVSGPHLQAQPVAEPMSATGAMLVVNSRRELARTITSLFEETARRAVLGEAAYNFAQSRRGALQRTLALIGELDPVPFPE